MESKNKRMVYEQAVEDKKFIVEFQIQEFVDEKRKSINGAVYSLATSARQYVGNISAEISSLRKYSDLSVSNAESGLTLDLLQGYLDKITAED